MRYVCSGVLGVAVLASAALGQSRDPEEIRRLISALEDKLQAIETARDSDGRVTEIGGSLLNQEVERERLIVRIYDISDLFSVAPPYPARRQSELMQGNPLEGALLFPTVGESASSGGMGGMMGGMGGMGGGMFDVPSKATTVAPGQTALAQDDFGGDGGGNLAAAQTSIEGLIQAIQTAIEPNHWDDVGGPGSIARLGNALLISANATAHQQIQSLLDLFRKRWGSLQTVSVEAHWLWLSPEEKQQLLVSEQDRDVPTEGLVNADVLKRDYDEVDESVAYRASVTCYNGQTVSTVSGAQELVITGIVPVVGDGPPGYQPQVSVIQEGAALQVTPLITSGGEYVILDVHSRVVNRSSLAGVESLDRLPSDSSSVAEVVQQIDRPRLQTHRLSTTLRVPIGAPLIVGGMTMVNDGEQRTLYLVVRCVTQELRDDQQQTVVTPNGGSADN